MIVFGELFADMVKVIAASDDEVFKAFLVYRLNKSFYESSNRHLD